MDYKWSCPQEWLIDKIQGEEDINELKAILCLIVMKLDDDFVHEIFQEEMDRDGYFEKNEPP